MNKDMKIPAGILLISLILLLPACGEKAIRPTLIQRPSRKIMQTDEMLKGYKIILGADLNAKI